MMNYEAFKAKVDALIRNSGSGIKVKFFNEAKKGRFYANCSDGTTIIGCPSCLRVTVKWGNYHQGMATI